MIDEDAASLAREIRYLQKALDRLAKRVEALEKPPEPKNEGWEPRQPIYPTEWVE